MFFEPRAAPQDRTAFLVVAELPSGLLYYKDMEEGFEVGISNAHGTIRDNGCNQLELTHALSRIGI